MNYIRRLFTVGYAVIAALFAVVAVMLIVLASVELWHVIFSTEEIASFMRFRTILESLGLLTIAIAALDLSQTVLEEEVQRRSQVSLPTRVRRFLSRFMIVIVVALSIEFLVATFELVHQENAELDHVALLGFATATLLAAWGLFIWFNRSAEELEPEALQQVQQEDAAIERAGEVATAPVAENS